MEIGKRHWFAGAVLVLLLLLVGGAVYLRWWDKYVEDGLGSWGVAEVSRRTGGAYRLILGDLDFRPLSGSLSFDSAVVVTDTAANRSRAAPLPILNVRAVGCRLSGVHALGLLLSNRFDAGHMGCGSVSAAAQLVRVKAAAVDRDEADTNAPGERAAPPLGITYFRIANFAFPTLIFSLRRPGPRGETYLSLDRARLTADLLEYNPTAPLGHRAGSSKNVRLEASGFMLRPDTVSEFAIGKMDVGLSDSTMRLDSIVYRLRIPDSVWAKAQSRRRDRITFSLDSMFARGVALRTFMRTGAYTIRTLEVDGAHLDVLSDKRLPPGPPKRHSTPQQAAQRSDPPLRVDTLIIRESQIVYGEHKPKRDRPGLLTFAKLQGTIANIHVPSSGEPLEVDVNTRLMNSGLLSAHATIPLDAPDFRFKLSGRVAAMPTLVLNEFLEHTESMVLKGGTVDSLTFAINTAGGVSKTALTPYYHDLAIDFKGGGVGGFLKAGLVEFAANKFKVRSTNPEEPGKPPRRANTTRTYESTKSWLSFMWLSLRDGLMKTIIK